MCLDFRSNLITSSTCVLLYTVNRFTKFHEINENCAKYIWDYTFTDCLCVILNLSLANLLLAVLKRNGIYDFKTIGLLSLLSCFIWEVFMSWLKAGYTFDIFDCIAYLVGGTFYYLIMKTIHKQNPFDIQLENERRNRK